VWLFGVPTALDRLIQQALLQVLTPVFDPLFSDLCFGFRPGRSAHQAIEAARQSIEDGAAWESTSIWTPSLTGSSTTR